MKFQITVTEHIPVEENDPYYIYTNHKKKKPEVICDTWRMTGEAEGIYQATKLYKIMVMLTKLSFWKTSDGGSVFIVTLGLKLDEGKSKRQYYNIKETSVVSGKLDLDEFLDEYGRTMKSFTGKEKDLLRKALEDYGKFESQEEMDMDYNE